MQPIGQFQKTISLLDLPKVFFVFYCAFSFTFVVHPKAYNMCIDLGLQLLSQVLVSTIQLGSQYRCAIVHLQFSSIVVCDRSFNSEALYVCNLPHLTIQLYNVVSYAPLICNCLNLSFGIIALFSLSQVWKSLWLLAIAEIVCRVLISCLQT